MLQFNSLNRFDQLEWIGRLAVSELLSDKDVKYTKTYENFDAYFPITNSNGEKELVWIETKIRYSSYDNYVIEKSKLDKILNKRKIIEDTLNIKIHLFYLNFTPTKTYMWNMDKIENRYKLKTLYAAKYTAKASEKLEKLAYYLPIDDAAKTYNYKIDINRLTNKLKHIGIMNE